MAHGRPHTTSYKRNRSIRPHADVERVSITRRNAKNPSSRLSSHPRGLMTREYQDSTKMKWHKLGSLTRRHARWCRRMSEMSTQCPRCGRQVASCLHKSLVRDTAPWHALFRDLYTRMRRQDIDICLSFLPLTLPEASVTTIIQVRQLQTSKSRRRNHLLVHNMYCVHPRGRMSLAEVSLVKLLLVDSKEHMIRSMVRPYTLSHTCNNGLWCDSERCCLLESGVVNFSERNTCFHEAFRAHRAGLPVSRFCLKHHKRPCDLWKAIEARFYPGSMIIKESAFFRNKASPADLSPQEIGEVRPVKNTRGIVVPCTELDNKALTWIEWDHDDPKRPQHAGQRERLLHAERGTCIQEHCLPKLERARILQRQAELRGALRRFLGGGA